MLASVRICAWALASTVSRPGQLLCGMQRPRPARLMPFLELAQTQIRVHCSLHLRGRNTRNVEARKASEPQSDASTSKGMMRRQLRKRIW